MKRHIKNEGEATLSQQKSLDLPFEMTIGNKTAVVRSDVTFQVMPSCYIQNIKPYAKWGGLEDLDSSLCCLTFFLQKYAI